jgi:low affinity Fe/Cu permease
MPNPKTTRLFEKFSAHFNKITRRATNWLGSPFALILAFGSIIAWIIYGCIVGFTSEVQLVANTGTTLITYAMVFVVQSSQNSDSRAIQLKLNELIRTQKDARNAVIGLEERGNQEAEKLRQEFKELSDDD